MSKVKSYILVSLLSFIIGLCISFFNQGGVNKQIELLTSRITEGEQLNKELRERNNQLITENTRAQSIVDELRAGNIKLATEVGKLREDNNELRTSADRLREENTRAQVLLGEVLRGFTVVGGGLTEAEGDIRGLAEAIDQLKKDLELLP